MEVLIQSEKAADPEIIDSESLEHILHEEATSSDGDEDNEALRNARYYHRAITDGKQRSMQLSGLGHCELSVLVEEDMPKKVALVRKTGMLIDDRKTPRLQRWPGVSDFAATFACLNPKGNALLRKMGKPST